MNDLLKELSEIRARIAEYHRADTEWDYTPTGSARENEIAAFMDGAAGAETYRGAAALYAAIAAATAREDDEAITAISETHMVIRMGRRCRASATASGRPC